MAPRASVDERERLYNRLATLRTDRGWSRSDLAEAIGVHYQTVGYLERGEYAPSLHLALRIASLFGASVEQVFSLEPFPPITLPAAARPPVSTLRAQIPRR